MLRSLRIGELVIPFKQSFKHQQAERNATSSLLVIAETATGVIGVGEGCPRSYVTGETIESGRAFLRSIAGEVLANVHSLADLRLLVSRYEARIEENPAAWCAMELALLDIIGRELGKPLEVLLGQAPLREHFAYTAVFGSQSLEALTAQLKRYSALGFQDAKLKISDDPSHDARAISLIADAGMRIRLDANNRWSAPDEVVQYLDTLPIQPFALEEPLTARDYEGLAILAKSIQPQLILDESATRLSDIAALKNMKDRCIVNLRVSKMGGLFRSLAFANACTSKGIRLIIGAQVGETSVLTRAALCVANVGTPSIIAQEGAFGTFLLAEDIVAPPLCFGPGGVLATSSFREAPGLGLEYCIDPVIAKGALRL